MKKQLALSAIVFGIAFTGALGHSEAASACPFARNKVTSNLQNSPNTPLPFAIKKSHSDMMFGLATTVGLLATGWVVASRLNHLTQVYTSNQQDKFEDSFVIPVSKQA